MSTKSETLVFKIIGFTDSGDCVAILENGKEILVDPFFVDCAFEYEKLFPLLNTWFKATGHWNTCYSEVTKTAYTVFLVKENEFHLLTQS